MKRTFYLIAVVLLVLSGSSTIAANVTWTGAGDGVSWSDPNNWSNNVVPGPTSDVIIGMVPGNPTIRITTAVQIHSLTSSEPINISAGSLTLAAPSSIDAAFIISNATLKVTGAGASFDATGPATVTDATFNAENGATVSFTSATLLTRVNLSATGG